MRLPATPRRRERESEQRQVAALERYERFVGEFGAADNLTDQKIAALVKYFSDSADIWPPTVAAELLRGRVWDPLDENDELNEETPRINRIVRAATSHARAA